MRIENGRQILTAPEMASRRAGTTVATASSVGCWRPSTLLHVPTGPQPQGRHTMAARRALAAAVAVGEAVILLSPPPCSY